MRFAVCVSMFLLLVGAASLGAKEAGVHVLAGADAKVSASSELESKKNPGAYAVDRLFDGNLSTAWSEGAKGSGKGEWILIKWEKPVQLDGLAFVPGYAKNRSLFAKNAAPEVIHLEMDGQVMGPIGVGYRKSLDFGRDVDPKALRDGGCYHTEASFEMPWRILVFDATRTTSSLKITVDSSSDGYQWQDMLISELVVVQSEKQPKGLPRSALSAIKLLLELRDGRSSANLFAPSVTISDWSDDRSEKVFQQSMGNGTVGDDWPKTETAEQAVARSSQALRWWKAYEKSLYNRSLAVGTDHVVGPVWQTTGDGEWIEIHPLIQFDASQRVRAFGEAIFTDGAPGCRGVLP